MNKQAPSPAKILTMVLFAASCIGLLLFLWISFGGSVPFAPEGYRIEADFNDAVQLAQESDVRISGVSVGKVVAVSLDRKRGLTKAIIQIESQYAPRPADTRAILRQKSLLGETYIELSPGSQNGPKLARRRHVAAGADRAHRAARPDPFHVRRATRRAFSTWLQQEGIALTGRGEDFNAAFAYLYPFATNIDRVLSVLNRDNADTSTLLREGGQVFGALAQSPAQLQGFVRNSRAVFASTAARNVALADTIRALPAFTVATRLTVARVHEFAALAKPLIDELRPAALQLTPTLQQTTIFAPELKTLLVNLAPLTEASKTGVPALERFLNVSVPWLARLKPYLGNFVPIFNYINDYRRELAAFFANATAATQATAQNIAQTGLLHYIRISNPVNPEVLTGYPSRLESNRGNPYMAPGGYEQLLHGLSVFGEYLCTSQPQPTISPTIPANLMSILKDVYYTSKPGGPVCKGQGPLGEKTTGQQQAFPTLKPLP